MLRATMDFASRVAGPLLILVGLSGMALAGVIEDPVVPEIDPAMASSAIALLVGAALVARDKFRSR